MPSAGFEIRKENTRCSSKCNWQNSTVERRAKRGGEPLLARGARSHAGRKPDTRRADRLDPPGGTFDASLASASAESLDRSRRRPLCSSQPQSKPLAKRYRPTMPHFAFAHNAAPWAASSSSSSSSQHSIPAMPAPFGATIAPGATHRLPFASAGAAASPVAFLCHSRTGSRMSPCLAPTTPVALAPFHQHRSDATATSSAPLMLEPTSRVMGAARRS